MLFEKQQHQQECVENIMQALQDVDFLQGDFTTLQKNLDFSNSPHRFAVTKKKQLDVLMETGTGKTFSYIKTIFEINKQFDHNKFIIVLPRTAIKLGTIQQIQFTKEYFKHEYNKYLNIINYPEDELHSVNNNFINSRDLSILLVTNRSFNSDTNKLKRMNELSFESGSTWQIIAKKNPVVIIDEPHLLIGQQTQKALDQLTNSLFIRFGATFPKEEQHKLANVAYTLDSISAFRQYLVKHIGVFTVIRSNESSMSIHNIKQMKSFDLCYDNDGLPHKEEIHLEEDIGAKTGLSKYNGVSVRKIKASKVVLSNYETLSAEKGNYKLNDDAIRDMIRETIQRHFKKEEYLFIQRIKALSLFFIPGINDFRGEKPRIKKIFEDEYKEIRKEFYDKTTNSLYKAYLDKDFNDHGILQVHEGYFSGDSGTVDQKEAEGVNLILKEKEKLLSFDTSLRFIFSVWALQEGWDNPNIFTLCKLTGTSDKTSHRQQVGRGLRIAVNQDGKRITHQYLKEDDEKFKHINTLEVVIPGKEIDFIYGIQNEIQAASFSMVGDILTLKLLSEKGLSDDEACYVFNLLRKELIVGADGIIQSRILDFFNHHRHLLSSFSDDRFEVIKKIFSNDLRSPVTDQNRKSEMVFVKKNRWKQFSNLWEMINIKSKIAYHKVQEDAIIKEVSNKFNEVDVPIEKIRIRKEIYDHQNDNVIFISEKTMGDINFKKRRKISEMITRFAKREKLSIPLAIRLFNQLDMNQFYRSPNQAHDNLKRLLSEVIHEKIINSVKYQFEKTEVFPNALQDNMGISITSVMHTTLGAYHDKTKRTKTEYLFKKVVFDSSIEKNCILNDPTTINDNKIIVFAKLPKINIPTPYKSYNPDFAYRIKKNDGKELFLVVETKGYDDTSKIPALEQKKIDYGEKFFMALQNRFPNVEIKYKVRINTQTLSDLLEE